MGMNEYKLESHPLCNQAAVVQGDTYRITVLTPALIRLEYHPHGRFEDRATQSVLNRDFPVPNFQIQKQKGELILYTDELELHYDEKPCLLYTSFFSYLRRGKDYANYRYTGTELPSLRK